MSEKIKCSLKEKKTFSSLDLTLMLLMFLGFLGLGSCSGGRTSSEVMMIRLLDELDRYIPFGQLGHPFEL